MRFTENFLIGDHVYFLVYKLINSKEYWIVDYSDHGNDLYEKVKDFRSSFEKYIIFCETIQKNRKFKYKQFIIYDPKNSELVFETKLSRQ